MWKRALPYVLVWLDALLLLGEGAPDLPRATVAAIGVLGALRARTVQTRPLAFWLAAGAAITAPVVLLATALHPTALARTVIAAVFGLFALYCTFRAIRG